MPSLTVSVSPKPWTRDGTHAMRVNEGLVPPCDLSVASSGDIDPTATSGRTIDGQHWEIMHQGGCAFVKIDMNKVCVCFSVCVCLSVCV